MAKRLTLDEAVSMITPVGHHVYGPVDPLDSDSALPKWSTVDSIEVAFKQIAGEEPKNWGAYIFALEAVIRQHEVDTAFFMYWFQHVINTSMRKYLPNGDGAYPTDSYGPVFNSSLFCLGSLSAVVSYFTGSDAPNPHFEQFFAQASSDTKVSSFQEFSKKVMQDLTDFYNMPGMPYHMRFWLRNYIVNVKRVLFYRAFNALEAPEEVPVL
jgi:hypothetical protein